MLDVLIVVTAFAAAFFVRYGGRVPPSYTGRRAVLSVTLIVGAYTLSNLTLRTYRIVWRFASIWEVVQLALTVLATVLIVWFFELAPFRADRPIPLSTLLIGGALSYLALGHVNMLSRLRRSVPWGSGGEPLIIFGAGLAGAALARQLQAERGGFRPVGFLDDDKAKLGRDVAGLPVLGGQSGIADAMRRTGAQTVALAIPSAPADATRHAMLAGSRAGARVLVVPSLDTILRDRTGRITLRDVALEDLLGRSEAAVDVTGLRAHFEGRRVLVTGAAGSIGSELARQVRMLDPAHIVLLDNNESGLADINDALGPTGSALQLRIATVHDQAGILRVFEETRPDVVIHAAALKHVDLVECQPHEAVRVNVLGTWICARAAEEVGVGSFILISTDKAVEPIGVLGASKRLGELMVAALVDSSTLFTAVRFGNVIGSRGSVLPRFEAQIKQGGPLTVTHPDVRRFFMTIDEAVHLVLQSACVAERGRVYVLDMGEDVLISTVAARLAQLHGLRVPRDIEIVYTGLRPGERLQEALVAATETTAPTSYAKVSALVGVPVYSRHEMSSCVDHLARVAATAPPSGVREELLTMANQPALGARLTSTLPGLGSRASELRGTEISA